MYREGTPPLRAAKLSTRAVKRGDVVLAMGAPWGLARSVTMGIISCTDRYLDGAGQYTLWYQTDAAISPGNSGGPLVDTFGEVVGVNARGIILGGQAFTIPSTAILEVLPHLRKSGGANWSWFGFKLQPLNDFDHNMRFPWENGVMVAGTDAGSPARKAGFLPSDRIVAVDGKPVTILNAEDLPAFERRIGRMPFGKEVVFCVERDGKALDISVAPCEKGRVEGEQKAYERWGLTVKEINQFADPDLAFFAPEGGLYVAATSWEGGRLKELQPYSITRTCDCSFRPRAPSLTIRSPGESLPVTRMDSPRKRERSTRRRRGASASRRSTGSSRIRARSCERG